jgi:hypothetical protein
MRLADDTFTLTLGSKTFVLRSSLRAASTLNLRYDGFQALSRAIADGHFSACADLISESCDSKSWIVYATNPGSAFVRDVLAARDQLLAFVLILAGARSKTDEPQTGKPISFEEYHTRLFRIGTGWLGWSPEVTWAATPAEILNAYEGRLDMLMALFGKRSEEDTIDAQAGLDRSTRDELNALGDLGVISIPRAR